MTKSDKRWYIAFVKSCQERKTAEALSKMGVESYLPLVREIHQWSDRKKVVFRLLLPHLIFVRTDELERRKLLEEVYGMYAYMMDRCTGRPAIVRDQEMEALMAMVEHSGQPVQLNTEPLEPGDRVRVLSGPLKDMEYELVRVSGRRCIAVRLDGLGVAMVEFSMENLQKIQDQ